MYYSTEDSDKDALHVYSLYNIYIRPSRTTSKPRVLHKHIFTVGNDLCPASFQLPQPWVLAAQLSTASCRCNPTHNAYLTLHARLLLAGVALAPVLCNPQVALTTLLKIRMLAGYVLSSFEAAFNQPGICMLNHGYNNFIA